MRQPESAEGTVCELKKKAQKKEIPSTYVDLGRLGSTKPGQVHRLETRPSEAA